MLTRQTIKICLLLLLITDLAAAQGGNSGGGVKGKIRVPDGATPAGINVSVRQGETEVARGETDRKGQFEIRGLAAGRYSMVFRKPGLSVAEVKDVDIEAGKVKSIKSGSLFLPIDEGTIAFLRGSVFNADGRSVPNVKIELARIEPDGDAKKIDGRLTSETGAFVFRLTPEVARYRVTAKMDGMESATQDVNIEGAAIYRIALTLKPTARQPQQ